MDEDLRSKRYAELVEHLVKVEGSKAAAARRLGISAAYVAKILDGKAGRIGGRTLLQACMLLGVDLYFFESDTFPVDQIEEHRGMGSVIESSDRTDVARAVEAAKQVLRAATTDHVALLKHQGGTITHEDFNRLVRELVSAVDDLQMIRDLQRIREQQGTKHEARAMEWFGPALAMSVLVTFLGETSVDGV